MAGRRADRKKDPDAIKADKDYNKKWREANPDKVRAYGRKHHFKSKYDMAPEERDELLEKQGFVCAVCSSPEPGKKGWHTDHLHGTKIVRGILCRDCNLGLGLFKDNPAALLSAAAYLNYGQQHG